MTAVAALDGDGRAQWRDQVRRTFTRCLSPGPGERLAIRPDAVGGHLLLTVLTRDLPRHEDATQTLLERALRASDGDGLTAALFSLYRAGGQRATDRAVGLMTAAVSVQPLRCWPLLDIATLQRGATDRALRALVDLPDTPLPLDKISSALPCSPLGLSDLARVIDERRLADARANGADTPSTAELLGRLFLVSDSSRVSFRTSRTIRSR